MYDGCKMPFHRCVNPNELYGSKVWGCFEPPSGACLREKERNIVKLISTTEGQINVL